MVPYFLLHIDKTVQTCLLFTMPACIYYTWNTIIINLLVMRANYPSSSRLKRMHSITSAYSISAVLPLPFVNMDPNNLSTMFTCILYAAEQRSKWGWSCIAITVDHPLLQRQERWFWLRGQCSPLSGVVIRLGGFHLLLSSMGSICIVAAGNGTDASSMCTSISHLNETIHAKNSVVYMVEGRACAKGIRIHLLSDRTLPWQHYYRSRWESKERHHCSSYYSNRLGDACSADRTEKLWV